VFWTIYSYDRNLVFPVIVDEYVSPHINHLMHTNVGAIVVLEMVLRPHYYHHRVTQLMLLLLFCCSYLTW
jgi:hypothetical protein